MLLSGMVFLKRKELLMSKSEYKSNFDKGYFWGCFNIILQEPKRNTVKYLCWALCCTILPRFNDFSRDYKYIPQFKDCTNFEEVLSIVFEIEPNKIKEVLVRLKQFKNQNLTFVECMACAKKIK